MHYLSIIGYMGWGTVIAGIGAVQLYNPIGICFDSLSNSVIMANYAANNIVRWIIGSFSWILLAGRRSVTRGTSSTLLQRPIEVVLDPIGNLYVADRLNSRVPFFLIGQLNGTTIAGMPVGPGPTQLLASYGIMLDNDLNLYVSDTGNHHILKFQH